MLLKKFIYYLIGYVNIIIEGYYIERFINKCASENIFLWDIQRPRECIFQANVSVKDFKRLKKVTKVTKCRMKIDNKRGLPFIAHKYRKRKAFLILPIIILIILFITSQFVWNIDITGNESISREELLKVINENGITIGMMKNKINTDMVINNIRLKRDDISWVGIDIKGTNVKVEIVEAREKPEILDKNEYCNIVADKDGIIESINVKNGTAEVKAGDVVKTGDLLVSGIMTGKYTDSRKVHASADIKAKIWYSETRKVNKRQEIKKETGKKENYYVISINNFKINFNKSLSKFKNYDTIKNNKKLKLFNNFYLPIEFTKVTNIEMKSEHIDYTAKELQDSTIPEIKKTLDKKVKGKSIINENVITEEKDGFIEVKVIYEVLEDIGVEEKLEP